MSTHDEQWVPHKSRAPLGRCLFFSQKYVPLSRARVDESFTIVFPRAIVVGFAFDFSKLIPYVVLISFYVRKKKMSLLSMIQRETCTFQFQEFASITLAAEFRDSIISRVYLLRSVLYLVSQPPQTGGDTSGETSIIQVPTAEVMSFRRVDMLGHSGASTAAAHLATTNQMVIYCDIT